MKSKGIKFENLRVEMARSNLRISDIANELNYNRDTLGRKLSGKSPINLDEAFEIQNRFFPNCNLQDLFKELTIKNKDAS